MKTKAITAANTRQDGVDHIWVSPFGNTQIGKVAVLDWREKFIIPNVGEFISPNAFGAWLFTGNDNMRMSSLPQKFPSLVKEDVVLLKKAIFLAKFYQLSTIQKVLLNDKFNRLDLPWVEYKLHTSGIKEHHPDKRRAELVKEMVAHFSSKDKNESFETKDFVYVEILAQVMARIRSKFCKEYTKMLVNNAKASIANGHDSIRSIITT